MRVLKIMEKGVVGVNLRDVMTLHGDSGYSKLVISKFGEERIEGGVEVKLECEYDFLETGCVSMVDISMFMGEDYPDIVDFNLEETIDDIDTVIEDTEAVKDCLKHILLGSVSLYRNRKLELSYKWVVPESGDIMGMGVKVLKTLITDYIDAAEALGIINGEMNGEKN